MEGVLCWLAGRGFVLGEWKGFCVGWLIGILCWVSGRGFVLVSERGFVYVG